MKRLILIVSMLCAFLLPVPSWASFTFIVGCGDNNDATATTITATCAGVAAGDLVSVWTTFEGLTTTTVSVSDGTTTFTQDPLGVFDQPSGTDEPHSVMHYLLSSVATGSVTYTSTFGSTQAVRRIVVQVYRPSAAATFESSNRAGGTTGTALASGNITTVGTDGVAFGANASYGNTPSDASLQINGVNQQQITNAGSYVKTKIWSRTYSAGFTGQATATQDASNRWNCAVWAFQISAGANVSQFRKRRLP